MDRTRCDRDTGPAAAARRAVVCPERPLAVTAAAFFCFCAIATLAFAGAPGANGDLYVTGESSDNVVQFDGETGVFVGTFVAQVTPEAGPGESFGKHAQGLTFGPNGNLFVVARGAQRVREFDGQTGAPIGDFTPIDPPVTDSSGPSGNYLGNPFDLLFRRDGSLIVSSGQTNDALFAYGSSGESLGIFAIGGSSPGGMGKCQFLTVGPHGHVYATVANKNQVVEYHPTTGRLVRVLIHGDGIIDWANGLTFGSDGDLYVVSFWDNAVLKFDGQTGAYLGVFASGGGLTFPRDLTFGPNGNLFVTSNAAGGGVEGVIQFDGTTGAPIGTFATSASLSRTWGLTFKPAPPPALPAPTIAGISTTAASACDGLSGVTITGSNLDPAATTVMLVNPNEPLGTNGAVITYVGTVTGDSGDGTSLTVDFDFDGGARMAGGLWDLRVINPDGQGNTLAGAIDIAPCHAAADANLFVLGYRHRYKTRHGLFEYDGETGDLIGFVIEDPTPYGTDLSNSTSFVFGHDGNLLIHSQNPFPGSVLKYDSITGRKLGTWIPAETGGMVIPIKLAFAPDGNLLVLHLQPSIPPISGVLEFDGMSGAFLRELVPLGSCGLGRASDFSFGPNGDIYIVIDGGEDVFVFDRQTGACVGGAPLAGVTRPDPYNALQALEFSPHDGMLVLPWWSATASGQGRVTVHDPLNGNLLHTPIVPPAGGINSAYASAFGPNGNLFVAGRPDRVYQYDLVSQATLGIFASQNSLPSGADAWANEIAFQPLLGDANGDWTRDLADFAAFQHCFGSDGVTPADLNCLKLDYDRDGDVDPADGAALTQRMTGPK